MATIDRYGNPVISTSDRIHKDSMNRSLCITPSKSVDFVSSFTNSIYT